MSHLIDADVLIDEIKKDTQKVIKQDDRVGSFWLGYIAGLVIKQPSIQPERAKASGLIQIPNIKMGFIITVTTVASVTIIIRQARMK